MKLRSTYTVVPLIFILAMSCKNKSQDLRSPTPAAAADAAKGPAPTTSPTDVGAGGGDPTLDAVATKLLLINLNADVGTNTIVPQTGDACTIFVVELLSAQDGLVVPKAAQSFDITSTSGTSKFYSDETCTTAVTAVAVSPETGSGEFYFQDATIGKHILTVADPGTTAYTKASSDAIIATAAKLGFGEATKALAKSACEPLILQALTAEGSPITLGTEAIITLSSTTTPAETPAETPKLYSDFECNTATTTAKILRGLSGTADLFFKSAVAASSSTITATVTPALPWTAATAVVTIP